MRIPYGKGIELYCKTPVSIQKSLGIFMAPISRSTILGSGFHDALRKLQETQWYKPAKLREYQESRLRALVRHAYHNVPYYNRVFKKEKITPDDIQRVQDLKKIPILTKTDLRTHFAELIAVNAAEFSYGVSSTSGSTGKPVSFYLDQQNREMEYAAKWRQRNWANLYLNCRIATFRAFRGMRGTKFQNGKPRWIFNALSKELEFNIFAINGANLKRQVEKLKQFNPDIIEGYPSVIELVAKYVLKHDIQCKSPAAIQTSSESLGTRRPIIEEAFGCKVSDWYGQSEYVVSAGQCPDGKYHITESGIMEIIKDGEQVSDGEIGEIVGTGLYNYSMPLLRYQTTDLARCSEEKCNCGRGMPLVQSIEGRVSDSILSSDGHIITGPVFEHYWKNKITPNASHLDYVHVIQKPDRKIVLKVVKSNDYPDKETSAIIRGLKEILGEELKIEFVELLSVPVQKKWRFSESELNLCLT